MNDSLRRMTYPKIDVFLMCFSIDSLDSLKNIEIKWMPEIFWSFPTGSAISPSSLTF